MADKLLAEQFKGLPGNPFTKDHGPCLHFVRTLSNYFSHFLGIAGLAALTLLIAVKTAGSKGIFPTKGI